MTWESDAQSARQSHLRPRLVDIQLTPQGTGKGQRNEGGAKQVPSMSTALDFASIRGSSAADVISAVQPQSSNPTRINRLEGRPVVRSPENLKLHRALEELDLIDVVEELNDAARLKDQSAAEPILITTNGTVLAGLGRWRFALFDRIHEIPCIEYQLSEDESLQFMLSHHQTRRGWNAFFRIRLALTLEPYFQQRALENMRAGGKYKGLANLPEAQHIDVRQEIAGAAGVGARNVSNAKTILKNAHRRLIAALLNGTLTINGAMPFCTLPKAEQLEALIRRSEDREINKVIRKSIGQPRQEKTTADVATLLDALQQQETRQPGSVLLQVGRFKRTVILIGQDLLTRTAFSKGA
ncbi:MAG: hypothetical protein ACLPPV_16185 [Candidatus Korobacteraceae bacterium]|jgi:hypothetical protein